MLRVGLTGGIATGKSVVGRMFADLGCHLIDADRIVHELLEPGQSVHQAVVAAFGKQILRPDGTIDRKILGKIVFRDEKARQNLNSIVHPATIQRQKEWLDQLEAAHPNAIGIVEAALMVEVGTYRNYDKLIVVVCSLEEQRRRLRARSHLSEDEINARIASQMPLDEKAKFADFVIDSSGELEATRRQVEKVNSKLQELAAGTLDRRRS
jgi:dephospho-CoA kinase